MTALRGLDPDASTPMGPPPREHVVVLALAVVGAAAAAGFGQAAWLPGAPLLLRSVIAFTVVKLAGDLTALLLWGRRGAVIVEDFLRGLGFYLAMGVLTAAAIAVAERFIGGSVDPAIPAGGLYLILLRYELPR